MAGDKKDKIKPWGPAADKKKENQEDEDGARFADPNAIGKYAKEWQEPVRKGIEHIATQHRDAKLFKLRGTDAHKSSKDKTETNRVVTVEGYDSAGNLIGTYHITKDARVKGKKGTFDYI